VAPELADPVGELEVGEHEDVEQLGAGSRVRSYRRHGWSHRSSHLDRLTAWGGEGLPSPTQHRCAGHGTVG
jgi:hypothetical protein